jgi:hypothetical protein
MMQIHTHIKFYLLNNYEYRDDDDEDGHHDDDLDG